MTSAELVLVSCYELGHQPAAVAWPAAFLEREGSQPTVIDLAVQALDDEALRRARVVAVSVPMHTALRIGMTVVERVRAVNPTCHVCCFGLYATLNAEYLLAHGVDSVIGGEAEGPLVELVRALEDDDARPIPGVTRRGDTLRPHLARLEFIVPSRRNLPPLTRYAQLELDGERQLVGYVETTRGCRHLCRHCPIPPVYGRRFVVVPRETCLADIRQLVAAGARHITFGDPDFLNGPGHTLPIVRAVHAEFPALTFDVTAKVEHLLRHRRHLPELAALGCLFVISAVESLSDVVLAHLAKGHTRADVVEALALTRAARLTLRPTWVPFTPWATLDDYRTILDFVADEHLVDHVDPVQYSIRLLVPPRSLLADSPAMRPYLGELVASDFCYRWTHPDRRMDELHEAVTRVVSAGAARAEDAAVTFTRIQRLADEAAGLPARPSPAPPAPGRRRPPRLTEPWFC